MRKNSLKKKITFTVIGAIIIAGSLATYSVFLYARRVLVEKEKEIILIESESISHEMAHIFDQYLYLNKNVANNEIIENAIIEGGENIQDKIEDHLNHYKGGVLHSTLSIADKDGAIVASSNRELVNKDISTKGYFKNIMLEGKDKCFSAALDNGDDGIDYFVTSPIMKGEGEAIGVVIVEIEDEYFEEIFDISEELDLVFVDKHGLIIYSSKEDWRLKTLGEISEETRNNIAEENHFPGLVLEAIQYEEAQGLVERDVSGSTILDIYDEEDGEDELVAITNLKEHPFFVIIETEKDIHVNDAIEIAYILSVLVGLSAASAGILIYFSINYYLSPLDKLHSLAVKASRGDYSLKIEEIEGVGEISDLSKSFNMMIENVSRSRDEISKKVDEQTRDIEEKREELEIQKSAILNILEDVKEERDKTEELAKDLKKFQLAVEDASDHIVITDPEGVILYANKAVEGITGFSNKEVVGKKAGNKDLWGGLMDKEIYKKFWDTIKNKKETFTGEFKNKRKNGEEYYAAASVSPVLDDNGEVIFFVGIERDITREKEIDKAKTEFVSLASHQLRTPLSAINWYTEMLMAGDAGKITKTQKDYLEEVYNGSNRMVNLVNALLNVSRIDLGTFAVDPENIDLKKISDEIIKELSPKIKSKKMKIETKYDLKLKEIKADPKLVGIIFQNLISNAVKYTSDGGKVKVKIEIKKPNVLISVLDDGFGIPKDQQSKIFNKLFRADNVREKETDGTGLGLYIVKSIVEQSGGKIWFESKENKGTKFYVELPLEGMKKKEGNKELT